MLHTNGKVVAAESDVELTMLVKGMLGYVLKVQRDIFFISLLLETPLVKFEDVEKGNDR